jgi:8-oxo-dGTP pyrophosphatase MutT (NUDIX family)
MKPSPNRKPVLTTPWFQVLATEEPNPHYAIQAPEFVCIVALTPARQLLLVRQYRAAVDAVTLELPAGHVEVGETPEQAARKELLEETGHQSESWVLLTKLSISPARYTNRVWCFFAADAKPLADGKHEVEAGLECVLYERGLRALLREPDFYSAGACAALLAALAQGKLTLDVST